MSQEDYDSMTTEELESLLDKGEGLVQDEPQEPEQHPGEPDSPEEPEAQPEESSSEPVESPEQGETSTVQPPEEPEVDDREIELQELRLQVKRNELDRQRSQFDRSREAGSIGAIRQELDSIKSALAGRQDFGSDDDSEPRPAPTFRDSRVDDLLAENKRSGVERTYQEFENELRGGVASELGTDATRDQIDAELRSRISAMAPTVAEEIKRYEGDNLNSSAARKVMRMALDAAHIDWQINRQRTMRSSAIERKASQVSNRKREKLAATDSRGAPPEAHRPKGPADMTAEEADDALSKLYDERR